MPSDAAMMTGLATGFFSSKPLTSLLSNILLDPIGQDCLGDYFVVNHFTVEVTFPSLLAEATT